MSSPAAVPPIFSFSTLKSNQREIKDRSKSEVVHITENGHAVCDIGSRPGSIVARQVLYII